MCLHFTSSNQRTHDRHDGGYYCAPRRSSDDRQGGNEARLRRLWGSAGDEWRRVLGATAAAVRVCSAAHRRTVRVAQVRSDVRGMRSRVRAPVGTIPDGRGVVEYGRRRVCGLCGATAAGDARVEMMCRRLRLSRPRWCARFIIVKRRTIRIYYNIVIITNDIVYDLQYEFITISDARRSDLSGAAKTIPKTRLDLSPSFLPVTVVVDSRSRPTRVLRFYRLEPTETIILI